MIKKNLILWFVLLLWSASALSGGSHIGNGDDGIDLEKTRPVKSGILVETRKKAVELLKKFDVSKIENLSKLIPEVEKTNLLLVSRDYKEKDSDKKAEVSKEGMVYARTMPALHAPTRFFPQALMLSEQELISLHIHEGLHRSLPEHMKTDESIVGEITLSMTSPEASFDQLKAVVDRLSVQEEVVASQGGTVSKKHRAPQPSLIKKPSIVQYQFRGFIADKENELYPLRTMHSVDAKIFPLVRKKNAFGLGVGFSFFQFEEEENAIGPVHIAVHWLVATEKNYDINIFIESNTLALSKEELQRYTFFRDTYAVGAKLSYSRPGFYTSFLIKAMESKEREETLGPVTYKHDYPVVFQAELDGGIRMGAFRVGGFFNFSAASPYKVSGEDFNYESGRSRILSGGPQISVDYQGLRFGLEGRFIMDASNDSTLDDIGDTFGIGAGKGYVASRLGYAF